MQQAGSVAGTTMPDTSTKAGRHYTYAFEPLLSFSVGSDGWRLSGPEIVGDLRVANEQGQIIFSSTPAAVFDPSTPSEPKELPPPENADEWVSWFQNHPRLDTSKPAPVSVGGVSGAQLDVTAVSTPENFSRDYCGRWSCVPLFRYGEPGESQLNMSYADSKDRFIIMDIEGKTVIIDVYASEADAFRRFAPEAQKVLDTVKWEEGP